MFRPFKLAFTALLSLIVLHSKAQLQDSLNYAYEALPDDAFPTGLLHDQSALHLVYHNSSLDPHFYSGNLPGKKVGADVFEFLYQNLYYSQRLSPQNKLKVNGAQPHLLKWSELRTTDSLEFWQNKIPLHLVWMEFNELDSNSIANGWVEYANGQFHLIDSELALDSSRTYVIPTGDPKAAFAHAVQKSTSFFGGIFHSVHYSTSSNATVQFSLPSSLIQSNGAPIDELKVDFADGKGFVPVSKNKSYTIHYNVNSSTVEHAEKELRIRARKGLVWKESKFSLQVVFNVDKAHMLLATDKLSNPPCVASINPSKGARVSIRYADEAKGFQRPIMVVEGFEGTTAPYGHLSYESVSSGYIFNDAGKRIYKHMEKLALLYDSLEAEGFDIVHVDFEESKIPIAENAQTVLRVLNWIKGQNPVNPTIVVGASMGGLISRTALLKLEESNCCLNVAAYGTFDSPHDGAFIPIGLQAAAKRFSELIPMVASVSDAWNKTLNSIAARQMLIEHYDSTAYLDRIQFEQFISKGQPTTIRTFAISNGSDLALSTSMQDAGKRYINYGNQRAVVVRHHLGSSLDSVQFNFTGVTSNVKTVGGRSEAHAGATTYLFEGSPWMNVWRYKKMDWISQRGARRARWAFEAGQQYSFIPSSYVDAFILGIQRGTNKKLSRVYSKAQSAGVKAHESNYTFSLDEAPGSLTNTPEGFANFLVSVYSPTHSFIPTFSSLDIGANQNGTAVRGNLELIPFDTYYAPGLLSDQALGNQMHIFTNEEVIRFCLKNLKSIHRKIEPQGALVQDFNISKSSNSWSGYPSELGGLIVESTATLKVAHDGVIGRASSNQWADSQQNIRVFVSPSCHGETLLVRGALFLGQNNQRKADLVIRSGGTLRLAAGGILKIGEGSSLVVEEGASLVLEPGAKVHWSDGTIILHGIIEMEGGADFIPSGKGTIVVDNGGSISALQGGLIALEECEVELLSTLQVSASVSQFSLDNSEVKLYNQSHLILSCPVQLWNSSFSQIGAKQWSGVQLNGVSADLQHVRFEYGWPALSIGASTSWELQNAQFTDAIVGVQSKKEPLSFYSNSFYSCRTGADLEGVDLKMNQCSFQSCEFGAILHDLSGTATIEKSQFYGNYGTAVMVDAVNCRMKCNTFYNNNTGASVSGAHLNLGNNAGNTFSQNQTGLYIDDVMGLQLNQGHNVFSSNTRFDIEGSFHPNASIPYNGTTYALPSNYNSFSSFSSTSLWQGRHSVYLNYNPNLTVNSLLCPSKDPKKSQVEQAFEREEAAPTLYPNPTKGTPGQFTFEVLQEDAELLVVSASGQIVLRKSVFSGMESTEIPVPNASGVYTIQLNNSQIHYRLKWVVQ